MLRQSKKEFNPIELVPQNLQSNIAVSDNKLCVSQALKGELIVYELYNALKERKIVSGYEFFEPAEFNRTYSRNTLANIELSNEIQSYVKELLKVSYDQKVSDIHIKDMGTHGLIRFRKDGMMKDYAMLEATRCRSVVQGIYASMCQRADSQYAVMLRQDARIVDNKFLPEGMESCRVHTEPTEKKDSPQGIGSCMFIRLLYDITQAQGTLEERLTMLGFLEEQIQTVRYLTARTGLSICSGATGHGKSTVLKHIVESMKNETPHKHFMSVEDPPEYHLVGVDQIAVATNTEDRENAYTDAIAGTLRSDVDCLLIGELRYAEAMLAAINAAMSGHAVWATLHASDAVSIILRMATILGEKGYRNALELICEPSVVAGLEYQRLIPILCPHCSQKLHDVIDSYDKNMAEKINRALKTEDDEVRVIGSGCEHCGYTGLIGQQIAAEVIATDTVFLNHIKKGNTSKAKEYWIKEKGGITHVQHALKYVKEGKADPFITEDRLGLPLDFEVGL